MSSTLAAAKPISANVSSAASSSRSTVSARRRFGRPSASSTITMQDCIGYVCASDTVLHQRWVRPSPHRRGSAGGSGGGVTLVAGLHDVNDAALRVADDAHPTD